MEIHFDSVKDEGLHWEGNVPLDGERLDIESGSQFEASVVLDINPIRHYYQLRGRMKGDVTLNCSRCLEGFNHPYDLKFDLYIMKEPLEDSDMEVELKEDDTGFSFNHGDSLNLIDIITEQLILSLPMKQVCAEECKGLCANCGENLNTNECKCEKPEVDPDHPFAALAEIKDKKK